MDFKEFKEKYQKLEVVEYPNKVSKTPQVSISVPTYQHVNYIKECLDSILMQKTDCEFEILLGEDASSDGTREICIEFAQKYPDKIRLFLHRRENNISIGGSPTGRFNFLYNLFSARGKYIAICEGDDYWTDSFKLQKQVDFMEFNLEVGLVYTDYSIYNEKNNILSDHKKVLYNSKLDEFENYLFTGDIRTLTIMFRSKFMPGIINLFKMPCIENSPIGDRVLVSYIGSNAKIIYLNEVSGVYRIGENDSASNFKGTKKYYSFLLNIVNLNINLYNILKINNKKYLDHLLRRKRFLILQKSLLNREISLYTKLFFSKTFNDFWTISEFKESIYLIKNLFHK